MFHLFRLFPPLCHWQMVPLVTIARAPTNGDVGAFKAAMDTLFTVFRLQLPISGFGGGVCVIPGLSIRVKVALGFLVPALIAASMVVCYIVFHRMGFSTLVCSRAGGKELADSSGAPLRRKRAGLLARAVSENWSVSALLRREKSVSGRALVKVELPKRRATVLNPLFPVARPTPEHTPAADPFASSSSLLPSLGKVEEYEKASQPRRRLSFRARAATEGRPWKERLKGATLTFILFSYTSILSATLRLLSCYSMPGATGKYLFLDATVSCDATGWQAPLYVIVICVVGFAVALPLLTFAVRRRGLLTFSAVHRVLCEPYKSAFYYWESILLVQRLALAFLDTFAVAYPVPRLVLAGLLVGAVTMAQTVLRPQYYHTSYRLQSTLQASLLVIILINLGPAQTAQTLQLGPQTLSLPQAVTNRLADTLEILFVYIVPLTAIFASAPVSSWLNPISELIRAQ